MSDKEILVKSIYIIRNDINDKVYVGQSKKPARRFKEHTWNFKDATSIIHKAIAKYGVEHFYYEILEKDVPNFDERERYWIKIFNCITPNGYNIAEGGKDAPHFTGFDSHRSKFNLEEVEEIDKLLLNYNISIEEIAKYFNASSETISAINSGKRYHRENIEYPIRKKRSIPKRKTMLSKEIVDQIIDDLCANYLSISQIAKKYNTTIKKVSGINSGEFECYHRDNLTYPLSQIMFPQLKKQEVNKIKEELKDNTLSLQQIAEKYNTSYSIVVAINSGRSHKSINEEYPIRETIKPHKYNYNEDVYEEIRKMLKNGYNSLEIVEKLNLPNRNFVDMINIGEAHYSDKYSYPINKKNVNLRIPSQELIRKIVNEIKTTNDKLSIIGDRYNMSKTQMRRINQGILEGYSLPNCEYPLRVSRGVGQKRDDKK